MNQTLPQAPKRPFTPVRHEFLCTGSLHLATLLATLGIKPLDIMRGPQLTPQGTPKVRWTFQASPLAEEIIHFWNNVQPSPEFSKLTKEQRIMCVDLVSAFAGNLKHFVSHTKQRA